MEAEKENLTGHLKPLRRLNLLRNRSGNDMSIEAFMNEEPLSQDLHQSFLKGNKSAEKQNAKRRDANFGSLRETDSVQNQRNQEIGPYQAQMQMMNLARRRSMQSDVPNEPAQDGFSAQNDIEERTISNPFRRLGQRRRSSVLSTQEESVSDNSSGLFSNAFKPSMRRRSKLLQSLEQSPQEQRESSLQPLDTTSSLMQGPLSRRRSASLFRNRPGNDMSIEAFMNEEPESQELQEPLMKGNRSIEKQNAQRNNLYSGSVRETEPASQPSESTSLLMQGPLSRRRSVRLLQMKDIAECSEAPSYSDFEKRSVEKETKKRTVNEEEKKSFNKLASSQFSARMKLIANDSNSKSTSPMVYPSGNPSSVNKASGRIGLSEAKKAVLEKYRPMIEKMKEQRRLASEKSDSKSTPWKRLTPLRIGQGSQRRGLLLSSRRKKEDTINAHKYMEENIDDMQMSKECRRTLQFESGDEGDDSEDLTAPLEMMDMTNMITGSSILQCAAEECKESKAPIIKKSLLQLPDVELRRQNQIKHQKNESTKLNEENQNEFRNAGDFENEWSHDEDKLAEEKGKCNAVNSRKDAKPSNQIGKRNLYEDPDENVKRMKVTRERPMPKLVKPKIPSFQIAKKSAKHVNASGVRPVIAKPVQWNETLRNQSAKKAKNHTRRRTRSLKAPEVIVTKPDMLEMAVQTSPPLKCDASTNTKISFVLGKSLDQELVSEVETLSKAQEDIMKEAELVRERTVARRNKMKETGIMASFASTISPLRRMKAMMQERELQNQSRKGESDSEEPVSQAQGNKSVQFSETSIFYDAPELDEEVETLDTSVQECSSLNASQTHWNFLRHDNRFLQTPVSISKRISHQSPEEKEEEGVGEENEIFTQPGSAGGDKSPFTNMAGDCERPSLAPMTPHTRKEVSLLKLSLRKQLEQLYD